MARASFAAALDTAVRPVAFGQVTDGIPCTNESPIGEHIHVHLQVLYDGRDVPVPAGIGVGRPWQIDASGFLVSGSCFAWIHTHDASGVIHIVAPQEESFTLRQVFAVWGQPLSPEGALNYRGPLVMLVNGQPVTGDPAALRLVNLQNIALELGTPPATDPPPLFQDFGAIRY